MKEQLSHILDQSVCLSRKQMKEYLSGSMLPEELHAAELHISSCPLCSMAMEGFQEHSEDALAAIASLNSGFLKEHFDNIAPQIHLNSMAPAASLSQSGRRSAGNTAWVRRAGIAAALLLVCFGAWYLASRSTADSQQELVTNTGASASGETGISGGSGAVAVESAASVQAPRMQEIPAAPVENPASQSPRANAGAAASPANTRPENGALASGNKTEDPRLGAAYYYQPEPIPNEDPNVTAKTPQTILPSANDPAKTYTGPITSRTTKKFVPEQSAPDGAVPLTNASSGAAAKPADPAPAKPAAKRAEESSDQLFERGEYRSALSKYRQQLRSDDPATRHHASLQAARCYAALGEADKAEDLLRKVMAEGNGRERREARRLMRNLR